jgi:hypothetical protein
MPWEQRIGAGKPDDRIEDSEEPDFFSDILVRIIDVWIGRVDKLMTKIFLFLRVGLKAAMKVKHTPEPQPWLFVHRCGRQR